MTDPIGKKGYQIKDLKVALKQLESAIKNNDSKGRHFLIDGNNNPQAAGVMPVTDGTVFRMRYREAWANLLFCAVLSHVEGQDYTFQDDDTGDGLIVNRTANYWFPVEHVSAMDYQKGPVLPKGEERAIWAINHKIEKDKKNPGYAKGKTLIVFLDGAELWYPNRVGRAIAGTHNFSRVYCIGLTSSPEAKYRYSVSWLQPVHSPTHLIEINDDFTDWKITRAQ
jgi:hypothetical protein